MKRVRVDVARAAETVLERLGSAPDVVIVLGSGLGGLVDQVEVHAEIPFDDVPGLPAAGVPGHAGRYVHGTLGGRAVLMQAGRFHVYEGHPLDVVAAPVRIARALGVETLLLTNAAGGIAESLEPGAIMLIEDHLNLMARNPLMGPVAAGELRFPDMTTAYDPALRARAIEVADDLGIPLARGVYAAMTGPSFETPAEIRMLSRLGADAVGMSTVPEVVTARAGGMRCLAFSLITNLAAGRSGTPLSHEDVMEIGREAGRTMSRLVRAIVERLPPPGDGAPAGGEGSRPGGQEDPGTSTK